MTNYERHGSDDYWQDYYGQLEGAKITKFWMSDDGYPTFGLVHPKLGALVIEVSRDPEGNDPGFLFISDGKEEQDGI
jgi:hypothetical protein|tara:strand:- start:193 stop:423 length:231 start_codon:yes stop_codon:yes gene_type:complete